MLGFSSARSLPIPITSTSTRFSAHNQECKPFHPESLLFTIFLQLLMLFVPYLSLLLHIHKNCIVTRFTTQVTSGMLMPLFISP